MLMEIDGDNLTFNAIDMQGNVIDSGDDHAAEVKVSSRFRAALLPPVGLEHGLDLAGRSRRSGR